MTGISERQSLTREEKFVALVHLYAELRPFDAALDAAEADLLREQNEGPKDRTAVRDEPRREVGLESGVIF